MRKLVVSMNLSLDGFLSDRHSGLEWHFSRWTDDMAASFGRQLARADTLLMGRVTYQIMAASWSAHSSEMACCREDLPLVDMMRRYAKLVVSGTPGAPDRSHSRVPGTDLRSTIAELKAGGSKDIILYGSAMLLASLLRLDVIDEYRLWIHPVILGAGCPMFARLRKARDLELLGTETFSSGVVLLSYQCSRHPEPAAESTPFGIDIHELKPGTH